MCLKLACGSHAHLLAIDHCGLRPARVARLADCTFATMTHYRSPEDFRIGLEVASYTEARTLGPASFHDFRDHVRSLLGAGKLTQAARLWHSVFEVVHLPIPAPNLLDIECLPPMRRVVCTAVPCVHCDEGRRGLSEFPWLGTWSHRGVVTPLHHSLSQSLEHYMRSVRANAYMDLLLLESVLSPLTIRDIMPISIECLVVLAQPYNRRDREFDMPELFAAWRAWQQGRRAWRDPSLEPVQPPHICRICTSARAGRALWGWLGSLDIRDHEFPPMCRSCGDPTRMRCYLCDASLCNHCIVAFFTCPACSGCVLPESCQAQLAYATARSA